MIGLWSPWEMWSFLNLQVRLRMFSIVITEWIDRTFNMYGINRTVAINNTSHAGLFRKLTSYGILIFNCNLALTRSTLSHCRGDSLFKPLIIRAFCSPNLNQNLTMLLSWAQLNTRKTSNCQPSIWYATRWPTVLLSPYFRSISGLTSSYLSNTLFHVVLDR